MGDSLVERGWKREQFSGRVDHGNKIIDRVMVEQSNIEPREDSHIRLISIYFHIHTQKVLYFNKHKRLVQVQNNKRRYFRK